MRYKQQSDIDKRCEYRLYNGWGRPAENATCITLKPFGKQLRFSWLEVVGSSPEANLQFASKLFNAKVDDARDGTVAMVAQKQIRQRVFLLGVQDFIFKIEIAFQTLYPNLT